MRNLRNILFLLVIIAGALIFSLSLERKSSLIPEDKGLPDREIVTWMEINTLGFIHPDGSGLEIRKVKVSGTFFEDIRNYGIRGDINDPTWSLDGKYLAMRYSYIPTGGVPLIFSQDGKVFQCPFKDWLFGKGRVWVTKEGKIIAHVDMETRIERVVVLNMKTCEEIEQLFAAPSGLYEPGIFDIAYSNQKWLAIDMADDSGLKTIILDDQLKEIFSIDNGKCPAWSHDGEWLAYIFEEDLYFTDKYGKKSKEIADSKYDVQCPTWSADGKWLAFTTGYDFRKINVETGENIRISDAVVTSSWR